MKTIRAAEGGNSASPERREVPSFPGNEDNMTKTKRLSAIILSATVAAAWAGETVLPALSGLPELKIELELDFADHPVAGLPWLGHIRGSEFVFYDIKLHQVFRAALPAGTSAKSAAQGKGRGNTTASRIFISTAILRSSSTAGGGSLLIAATGESSGI